MYLVSHPDRPPPFKERTRQRDVSTKKKGKERKERARSEKERKRERGKERERGKRESEKGESQIEMLTSLETLRSLLAEVEEEEHLIVQQLVAPESKSSRKRLLIQHRVKHLLVDITNKRTKLLQLFGEDQAEEELLAFTDISTSTFYDAVKNIRASSGSRTPLRVQKELPTFETLASRFSLQESLGRYLDLEAHFQRYLDFLSATRTLAPARAQFERPSFLNYVGSIFFDFTHPSYAIREVNACNSTLHKELEKYLHPLKDYLAGFIDRVEPLEGSPPLLKRSHESLASLPHLTTWKELIASELSETLPPLQTNNLTDDVTPPPIPEVSGSITTMYCTVCQKSFKATVYPSHLQGKIHKAAEKNLDRKKAEQRAILALQYEISQLAVHLHSRIRATRYHVERKLSQLSIEYQEGAEDSSDMSSNESGNPDQSSDDEAVQRPDQTDHSRCHAAQPSPADLARLPGPGYPDGRG